MKVCNDLIAADVGDISAWTATFDTVSHDPYDASKLIVTLGYAMSSSGDLAQLSDGLFLCSVCIEDMSYTYFIVCSIP